MSPQIFTSAADELMPLKAGYPHSKSKVNTQRYQLTEDPSV